MNKTKIKTQTKIMIAFMMGLTTDEKGQMGNR